MKTFTSADLLTLQAAAQASPRRRSHHNIHSSLDAKVQRLCLVLQPDTYVRPHCHTETHKWELMLLLEGAVSVLILTPEGELLERVELSATGTRLLELPPFTWHTLVCQAPDTLLFEVKEGPYTPASNQDFAAWAPGEGQPDASRFLEAWRQLTVGDSLIP